MESQYRDFVVTDVGARPFLPWEGYRVQVGQTEAGNPLFDSSLPVATYYHAWQVFQLAEILSMGVVILVDLGDPDLQQRAFAMELQGIPSGRMRYQVRLSGLHGLREFPQWERAFNAVSYFLAYRGKALRAATQDQSGPGWELRGEALAKYRAREHEICLESLKRWGVDAASFLAFVQWQCARWSEHDRRGSTDLAEEYRAHIGATVRMYQLASGKDLEAVTAEVGRVTGHRLPTLEVLFPSWLKQQRERAAASLKRWIAPRLAADAGAAHAASEEDCARFLEWVEQHGLLEVHWIFEHLSSLAEEDYLPQSHGAAKEVNSTGTTCEHIVNRLGVGVQGTRKKRGLLEKVQNLWCRNPVVVKGLRDSGRLVLVDENTDIGKRLAEIDAVAAGLPEGGVIRVLLKMVFLRNAGVHIGVHPTILGDLQPVDLIASLLEGALLCWNHVQAQAATVGGSVASSLPHA